MADSNSALWIKHIECYVDSSTLEIDQVASLDAIATLLKNDALTIETLVREMEMYLTTTDNILRGRGILFLGELLELLSSKTLNDASIRSLTEFFTERLADWKALRGALVGCLALTKRKSNVGMITISEATGVANSFFHTLAVRSLSQYDRLLCFQLLECLLEHYPDAIVGQGDLLFYGICEALDGEMDPQCLMIAFHIVELLGKLFSDPSSPLSALAADLFDILGRYFPVHFIKGEEIDVKRDELSKALMLAFASTPVLEPHAIPLLLEKLSSSLPSSKIESLKYLSYCSVKYGDKRMENHAEALWTLLKDVIFSLPESTLSSELEAMDKGSPENEIAREAFQLLQKLITINEASYLNMIVADEDIIKTFKSANLKDSLEIPVQNNQKLLAVGQILSVTAQASIVSCNRVFESFFISLVEGFVPSVSDLSGNNYDGALFLCVDLLAASRHLTVGPEESNSLILSGDEIWGCMLQEFCTSLTKAFSSTLVRSDDNIDNFRLSLGLKGLQILATFPGSSFPVSKSIYENILTKLMSIITLDFSHSLLWKLSLKALVAIGSFIEKHNESEKAVSFKAIVVDRVIRMLSYDDTTVHLELKLQTVTDIGMIGPTHMMCVVQALEETIFSYLSEVYGNGNVKSTKSCVQLLECYCNKLLPWFVEIKSFKDIPSKFVLKILDQLDSCNNSDIVIKENELFDVMMATMKRAVAICSEESQSKIIERAFHVLLSREHISDSDPLKIKGSPLDQSLKSCEWIISLFSSVIIALHPQTCIPNIISVINILMRNLVSGHIPAAQALGSILNKLPSKANPFGTSTDCNLEEALDIVFNGIVLNGDKDGLLKCFSSTKINVYDPQGRLFYVNAIVGLAWIGKGLVMRGHEKLRDVAMTFLSYLLVDGDVRVSSLKDVNEQDLLTVRKAAADAFHILMSDSNDCLNKSFHAAIRPLYKQRFYSTMTPILLSSLVQIDSLITRSMIYRAFAHVICGAPLNAVLTDSRKLIPILLDSLTILSKDGKDKDLVYSLLLVLSGMLMDNNGQEAVVESVHIIVRHLLGLISYPHMMLVRETTIQCFVALCRLPYARIYPMRTQVLQAIGKALNDPKRIVREEAVRCWRVWASIASK
ncbi:MMS19 nucleotide excision repair protein homolog [Impatiens glandulifera]|uniref:MMS19 nucleotide excision repair protein homolog n=1 Tax=Impatiens glandulifera TaxID=253017 RepID=UPI001FB1288F|nr:MMS19 nucleotide excision repair protein homolog [Impatiens glandulifera]